MLNPRKAAVIGCGHVGASIAFSLMQRALFSEMVLLDVSRDKAEGEAMDLSHGLPYTAAMDIYAGGYEDLGDAARVIITAGANQRPGETRLDLISRNMVILRDIMDKITATPFSDRKRSSPRKYGLGNFPRSQETDSDIQPAPEACLAYL